MTKKALCIGINDYPGTGSDLAGCVNDADDGDTMVITYSGHRTWVPDSSGGEPDGRDEALCPHDIATAGPLLDDEIRGLFAARAAGVRILLISDSCHSGFVTRGKEDDLDPGGPRARFLPLDAWMSKDELPRAAAEPPAPVAPDPGHGDSPAVRCVRVRVGPGAAARLAPQDSKGAPGPSPAAPESGTQAGH